MRIATSAEIELYKKYLPIYFQPGYIKFQQSLGDKYYIVISDAGVAIPLKVRTRFIFKIGQYMHAPVLQGEYLDKDAEVAFIRQFEMFCTNNSICDFILPPSHHFTNFSAVPDGNLGTRLGIIMLDLQREIDTIFKAFSPNYRNEMRKAETAGVSVYTDNERFDEFYKLYKGVHARQHIYYESADELKNMLHHIGNDNYMLVFSVLNGSITGAALILKAGVEAIYYHSGKTEIAELPGANKLLQFEVMKQLKAEGIKRYYLGGYRYTNTAGTKYEGLQNFKMRFGAEAKDGFNFYSLIGWKYKLYTKVMEAYLKMRGVKVNASSLVYTKNAM